MIAYYALIILLVAVLVFVGYFFATIALKLTAHSKTGSFRFLYRGLYRTVPCPSYADSAYWNRFPNNTSASTHDFTYHGTIDDPFVMALAESVKGKVEGKTDAYKAGYILALVQQNVTYRKDTKTFGKAEKYGFPICTAYLRGCDCEDSAYLGASLSHLIGLDVAMFRVPGHMTYGVYLGGKGTCLEHDGKRYTICETTGSFPVGLYSGEMQVLLSCNLETPPEDYIRNHTFEEDFKQYKR